MFDDTDQRNICIDSLLQLKVFDDPDDTKNQNINYNNCKKYCESNDECKMCIVDKIDLDNVKRIVAFGIKPNETIIQGNDFPIKNCSNAISTFPSEQLYFYKSPPHDVAPILSQPNVSHTQSTMTSPVILQATPLQIQTKPLQVTSLQTTKPFCNKIDLHITKCKHRQICYSRKYTSHSRKYKRCNNPQVVLI